VAELVMVEQSDAICTIAINRPEKRNSVNPEILLLLGDTLNRLKKDGKTRVVVIRGAGEEAFSSGYDIGRIGGPSGEELTGPRRNPLAYGMNAVADFPFPVIAMIYGYAVGAGLELSVTCDLRFAAQGARLGITPAKLGVVYSPEGIQKFLNLVGPAATKDLFYTGRLLDAERALQVGLVDHVCPKADLARFTYDFAAEIAGNAPLSVSGTKQIIAALLKPQKMESADADELRKLQAQAMASEDLREGQRAFMGKRQPRFAGR